MRFRDRADAGRQLATRLLPYRGESCRVFGVARGGVRVGLEVSRALGTRLEVWVARRVTAPGRPALVVGGVAEGGAVLLDPESIEMAGLAQQEVIIQAQAETEEVRAEVARLRGGLPLPNVRGSTVLLVDDVALTGTTARVAVRSLRMVGARRVIFATPVASSHALARLRAEADVVVCVEEVPGLRSVAEWYEDFRPVTELEVTQLLERGRETPTSREAIESTDTGGRWM